MPDLTITRSSPVIQSPRVKQMAGIFDVPLAEKSRVEWRVHLPIEDLDWNVGAIIGPSGSGKSTVAREVFGDSLVEGFDWSADRSVIDDFPTTMGTQEITALLNSVGFSSPPAWVRPFVVLSTGEQFRVTTARAMAESADLIVLDEFTSVVDRTVAQVGSHAIAKTIRKRQQRFVAVTCHYDILDWLQPDWVYEPHADLFQRRSLRPRPSLELEIVRADRSAWRLFAPHHYLSAHLNRSAHCFVAFLGDAPVSFVAMLPQPGANKSLWRGHRTVTLPDFQGVGIGMATAEVVLSAYRAIGKRITTRSSHPGLRHHYGRSPNWKRTQRFGRGSAWAPDPSHGVGQSKASVLRFAESFEYVGPVMEQSQAIALIGPYAEREVGKQRLRDRGFEVA